MNRFGQDNWNTWRHTGSAADLLAVSPHTRSHRFRVRQSLTYSISIRYCRPGAFETYVAPSGAARYFRETGGFTPPAKLCRPIRGYSRPNHGQIQDRLDALNRRSLSTTACRA